MIFVTACAAILMVSIDGTIVATALPTLTRELHTTLGWSTWTIAIYNLGQITSLPIAGRLSDSLGRRRMFLIYVSVFTLSSLLAGLATNIYVLIGLRFIQALGGGGLMPSTTGVVADVFTRNRDRWLGLVTSFLPLGALIGPTLGGYIVTYFSWRVIFFVNVPVGVVVLGLLWFLLPAAAAARIASVDVLGAALLCGTLLCLMLGLHQIAERGPHSPIPWALLLAGAVSAGAFLRRQRRAPDPILPPTLLRRPEFVVVNGINILYGAAAFGIFSLVPTLAQLAYGMSPLSSGTLLSARAVGMASTSVASSLLLRRLGYRKPMILGFLVLATGLFLVSLPPHLAGPYAWLALSALVCGLGVGIAGPPSNNAAIQLMPDHVAAITGLRAMFRQTGGVMALTISAMIVTSSPDQVRALEGIFLAFSILTFLVTPFILRVPERRAWLRQPPAEGIA